jgi:hypothetical protein
MKFILKKSCTTAAPTNHRKNKQQLTFLTSFSGGNKGREAQIIICTSIM